MPAHRKRVSTKKYNLPPVVNTYRILTSFHNGQKYFQKSELGKYSGHKNAFMNWKKRNEYVDKMVNAGWLKQIILPQNVRRNRRFEGEVQDILQDPKIDTKISKMRGLKYYCITDKGKQIYRNIQEILDVMVVESDPTQNK